MYRLILSCCLLLWLTACHRKIHPALSANRYVSDATVRVYNDSLRTVHRALGDVAFTTDPRALRRLTRELPVDGVVCHGYTTVPAYYEYFLLCNPRRERLKAEVFDLRFDTLLDARHYVVLGRALRGDAFPPQDFRYISRSLAGAAAYRAEPPPLNAVLDKYRRSTKFLAAYRSLRDYPTHAEDADFLLQFQLTYLAMLGESVPYERGLAEWLRPRAPHAGRQQVVDQRGIAGRDSVYAHLLAATAGVRCVLFNENHFVPRHRIPLYELLPELRRRGFTHLALEALATDTLLDAGQPPTLASGFYTREANYHRLIRRAQALGFHLVAYDNERTGEEREIEQAATLYRKTWEADATARVVGLAGIGHIYETYRPEGYSYMAAWLRREYGVDPLTISQTHLLGYRPIEGSELTLLPAGAPDQWPPDEVDFHLINSLDWSFEGNDFSYKNTRREPVQLVLYDHSDWTSDYGFVDRVPDRSRLVAPGKRIGVQLPHRRFTYRVHDQWGELLEYGTVSN